VKGQPLFRFYAGAPVIDNEGFTVGSLCVIDYKPRKLDEREAQTLMALAALTSDEVRLRAIDRQLRETLRRAERQAPVRSGVAADTHKRGH
jgi:GAF domain-containing protein